MPRTSGHAHAMGEPRILSGWWRQLSAVLAGVAAAGVVVWGLGRAFFATRDEFTAATVESAKVTQQLDSIKASLDEEHRGLREIGASLADIKVRLVRIEARAERLTVR